MSIIRIIAKRMTKHPQLKRKLKNMYAYLGNILSDKKSDIPGLVQVSSNKISHNFGYYDKCPWSKDQHYMVYTGITDATHNYVTDKPTPIILYDCISKTETVLAYTHVWNSQQGCMLQWLGPDFSKKIIFNDFRDGKYCSVILNIEDKTEKVLKTPVYSVSSDGKTAITLDFSRLNSFGIGYGYCNVPDYTKDKKCPDIPCMWKIDIEKDFVEELPFSYKSLSEFGFQDSMKDGYHKINHIMLNPAGNRFMFIHRWIVNGVKHHRLLTCNIDGSDLYILLDHGMVSHNNWKDDKTIISFCYTQEEGEAYHILYDKTQKRETIGKGILNADGHPSYSPDGRYIITDTYPDFKRKQTLYLIRVADSTVIKLGSIYSSIKYKNEFRCDLHPRWNYNSKELCIDGAIGDKRQVFLVKISEKVLSD